MQLANLGPLPLSIIASLVVAIVLLALRIFVMQRIQTQRQRENRQETERLKSLVAAYNPWPVRSRQRLASIARRSRRRLAISCCLVRSRKSGLLRAMRSPSHAESLWTINP